jgi:ATP-binding cassette subfamily F protein 3
VILLRDIELFRGDRRLLSGANLDVYSGQKMGLVGTNGCGKSSLFKLIKGELQVDSGSVVLQRNCRIASVDQDAPALSCSVLEHTIEGHSEYCLLEQTRFDKEQAGGKALADWYEAFAAIDGYSTAARAARLLAGLGFDEAAQSQSMASFSGGWRMRVNIARALLQPSDLLLLDEPTNHLDLDAIVWLERWLVRYQGTLLVISHDREFLDRLVDSIGHISNTRIDTYRGNYSSFERQRGERLTHQQGIYEKQKRERVHLQQFVDRFRSKASKAKQAQSRIKALEKLQAVAPVYASGSYHFEFVEPEALSSPLIAFDNIKVGYKDNVVLDKIHINLLPGSRIGLLGRNGAGKSTFIKLLAGKLPPLKGTVERGRNLSIGYFDQQQLEALDLRASPLLHLQRLASSATEQQLRDFLGRFGFDGERVRDAIEPFSSGEKSRLALALLVWQKPNLLLLDEPTNHLDADMREALIIALQAFTGAVVIVSHDRHMLRTVADELYLVHAGKIEPFDGDIDDYQRFQLDGQMLRENDKTKQREQSPVTGARLERQDRKKLEAEFRQQTTRSRKELDKLTKQIERYQARLVTLTEQLADSAFYENSGVEQIAALTREHGELKAQIDQLELSWLDISEELEIRTLEFEQNLTARQ